MQITKETTQQLIEIKQIDRQGLEQLLTSINWEVRYSEFTEITSNLLTKSFTCINLNEVLEVTSSRNHAHALCIEKIDIQETPNTIGNKIDSNIDICFTHESTRQIFAQFNATPDNFHTLFDKHFKYIHSPHFGLIERDDINNFKLILSFNLRSTYKHHAFAIYNFIKMSGDDISEEMWSKLEEILPFREKCNTEIELEAKLKTHFKTIPTLPVLEHDTDFTSCLKKIVDISTQLSEIQQSQYVFYTTAKKLVRLGFDDQAKEILDQTIMFNRNIKTPFLDKAATLAINILMNKCSISSNKDSRRKLLRKL